jgi:hypothetical protein
MVAPSAPAQLVTCGATAPSCGARNGRGPPLEQPPSANVEPAHRCSAETARRSREGAAAVDSQGVLGLIAALLVTQAPSPVGLQRADGRGNDGSQPEHRELLRTRLRPATRDLAPGLAAQFAGGAGLTLEVVHLTLGRRAPACGVWLASRFADVNTGTGFSFTAGLGAGFGWW